VIRDISLFARRAANLDQIREWQSLGKTPQSARFKLPQAIAHCHARWDGLAENSPRLVSPTGKRTYIRKFCFGIFGPIATTKRPYNANQLTTELKPALYKGTVNHLAQERITCDKYVTARPQRTHGHLRPFRKELGKLIALFCIQGRESRKRLTDGTVKGGRDSPNAPISVCTLL
jgi:hypothetical protein